MDRIKEMMDSLSELSDEQVTELQSEIISEFETVEKEEPTPQTVDAMTSLADMLDTVRTEVKRREAAAIELVNAATEAATRVHGQSETEDGMAEGTEEAPVAEEVMEAPEAPMEEEVADETGDMTEEVVEEVVEEVAEPAEESEESEEEDEEKEKKVEMSAETPAEAEASVEVVEEAEASIDTPVEAEASAETSSETVAETSEVSEAASEEAEASATTDENAELSTETPQEAEAAIEVVEAVVESTTTESMEAPVTAAADNADLSIEVPADRRPTVEVVEAPVAITAGADIPGYTAGSPLSDMNEVAEAMSRRLHGLRNIKGGDGDQHIVASLVTSYPQERILTADSASNAGKIDAVQSLVASGGHQAPFEVRYDIFGFGSDVRPVRDSLPRFQADRGGIRYILPPVLADYDNAVGVWTAAVDADPQSATKTSLTVAAASETTVATDAVTLQMQFGNMVTRAYPELIARHNELGLIRHAREAEQYLLSKIGSGSTAVTTSNLIGVARDFLVQIGRAAAAYRSRHRLDADAPLRAIAPAWVKDAMQADLALSMPGDGTIAASEAEIEGYLAARGVQITWTIDGDVYGAQSSGALNEFADTFVWYLFAEGTFLFLDGGTLDIGIIRDSTLVGTNDYKMFIETFEGIAKVGVEGLKVTSTISVNGAAAALRDTTGGATAAAIEL